MDTAPHLMDTTFGYQNVFSMAAPGQAKAYYRDVALALTDVHAVSESNMEPDQAQMLEDHLQNSGHRMWAAHRTSRDSQKGTRTVIVAKSTVSPKPGDGIVYTKSDGKALAVALTITGQAVVLLAMHLPHTDADQEAFLKDVTQGMQEAMAKQVAKVEKGKSVGAPWARPIVLRAGDMNMTTHPLDEEEHRSPPGPQVIEAMRRLDETLGCDADVYRTIEPQGVAHTHGKQGHGRRIDTFGAPDWTLRGPKGVVAHRVVSQRATAYSYCDTSSRKEVYKESDHAMIQITLRVSEIVKPKPKPSVRLATLRSPEVRKATDEMLRKGDGLPDDEAGYQNELHFAELHEGVLRACMAHEKREKERRSRKRQRVITQLERLDSTREERWRKAKLSQPWLDKCLRTERHIAKLLQSLQQQQHAMRRHKDAEAAYEAHMLEAGMGKAPKPVIRPEPVTKMRLNPDGTPLQGDLPAISDQAHMLPAVTEYYRAQLNKTYQPPERARQDRQQILDAIWSATENRLPQSVLDGLSIEAITHLDNIIEAIRSLHRESTPGVDAMPLDFYLEHLHTIAPQLSALFREQLRRGEISQTMRHAVLTPLYKEKGERDDAKMYRPVSVTTMEYRILAKCIALKLNLTVTHVIGDPQVGFSPGRLYDENIALVRETVASINSRYPEMGGMILFLDNEKAFDRVQHDFMFATLRAFHIPEPLVRAIEVLYSQATTSVKLNGEEGRPFSNTSGIRQGCPLSPLLYIYVQEVQMRMLREDTRIEGIPIPDFDGREPHVGGCGIKERGLVDDIMVAVKNSDSIPPLLDTLDRFEKMSYHKMNVDKTMLLLLGDQGSFDINGPTVAAAQLRARGLARTHDVRTDVAMLMPDKWHGIVLGNDAGTVTVWQGAVDQAVQRATALRASAMPHGSRGRTAQASGKVMGKAKAALQYTVPHSQKTIEKQLGKLQSAVSALVLGKGQAIKTKEAVQPRGDMGIGMLSVEDQMAATWARPLLAAMGATAARRPFENYYAEAARRAYPEMGMGRELLRLNLGMYRILELPRTQITGEMRQAFVALMRMPPMQYLAPGEDSEVTAREHMTYEELVEQPLMYNPHIQRGAPKRATREQEEEVMQWAALGITRVKHVLAGGGTRVATTEELIATYPGLRTTARCQGRVRIMRDEIEANLRRWKDKLSKGMPATVKRNEFRRDASGQIWRAVAKPRAGEQSLPAERYEEHPHTGRLTRTDQAGTLPARREESQPCHVATTEPESELGTATAAQVHAAQQTEAPHTALAPSGSNALADASTVGWRRPETATASRVIALKAAATAQVREVLLAQKWQEPRVFGPEGRHEALMRGVPAEKRRQHIGRIAAGINHWAIPQDAGMHLCKMLHSGLFMGAVKCSGDKAMCAHCLRAGTRVEETAQHVHHTCPKARAVWEAVIRDWNEKTGDTLDPSDPKTAVAGLREAPREIAGPVKQEWEAREPAWRLLHAVTCQEIYRARCRVHAAYHASPRGEAKAVKLRDVIQRIRRTIQRRVEYEHSRAAHARQHSHQHGPMAAFQRHWVTTGVAAFTSSGPRATLLGPTERRAPVPPGCVHLRTVAAVLPSAGRREASAGWVVTAGDVKADGVEEPRLTAEGKVPTVAAMGSKAPPQAATKVTAQAAHQAAIGAALVYAGELLVKGARAVAITVESVIALRNLRAAQPDEDEHPQSAGEGGASPPPQMQQGTARETQGNRHKKQRVSPRPDRKRGREHKVEGGVGDAPPRSDAAQEESTEGRRVGGTRPSDAALNRTNRQRLDALSRRYPGKLELRAPNGATPIHLRMQAQAASRLDHIEARVTLAAAGATGSRLVSIWDQTRTWDPGD